jgi:hypothetical protein
MIFIGIDPGISGGIVGIDEYKNIMFLHVMPSTIQELEKIFSDLQKKRYILMIYLEKAQAFPGNGSVSMFNYGCHFGELLCLLKTMGIPYELVPPQTWTKKIHLPYKRGTKKTSKEKSKESISILYPGVCLKDPSKKKAKEFHLGLIDALLIAEFGRQKLMKRKNP